MTTECTHGGCSDVLRNAEVKCKTVSWKEGENGGKMSGKVFAVKFF